MVRILFVVLLCTAQPTSADEPPALALLKMLHAREFTALADTLAAIQRQYEVGEGTDTAVDLAFRALANGDPAHQPLLDGWVSAMPERFEPYAVRGRYLSGLGWMARGDAWASETSTSQFQSMRQYHAAALLDLQKAVALNPKYLIGYIDILGLRQQPLDGDGHEAVLAAAMALDPSSYELHKLRLNYLQPRWGGSYEKMRSFLQDTRRYAKQNPRLAPLLGYESFARGYVHASNSRYVLAVEEYNKALEFGETSWYYTERGIAHRYSEDNEHALADFDKALTLWPHSVRALTYRAITLRSLGRVDEALENLTLAATLSPHEETALDFLGRTLADLGRNDEALKAFDAGLLYAGKNSHLWRSKGWHLLIKLKRPGEAVAVLRVATQRRPDDAAAWLYYGVALNETLDCGVMVALDQHLRLCRAGADTSCGAAETKWSQAVIDSLSSQGKCPLAAAVAEKASRAGVETKSADATRAEAEYPAWVGVLTQFLRWLKTWLSLVFN